MTAVDELSISFATAADKDWLIRNDSNRYISPRLVGEKTARKEYVIARLYGDIVGHIRFSCF